MRDKQFEMVPSRKAIFRQRTEPTNSADDHQGFVKFDKEDAVLVLAHLMSENAFLTFYQPIRKLDAATMATFNAVPSRDNTKSLLGYEALTRISSIHNRFNEVEALFRFAEESDMLLQLENQLWRIALLPARQLCAGDSSDVKLFLNSSPKTLQDPKFNPFDFLKYVRQAGISYGNVVLEITERVGIKERWNEFREVLKIFKDAGIWIAMDDTGGAGHNSFAMIADLRPDYLKIDGTLINGIHSNQLKRTIVEALVRIAKEASAVLIAEGIERFEEVEVLMDLGVEYGQGNFLGFPKPVTQKV
jgi:EAL domain-containing protein (putative c-di-GMP-specific phosphodiesterase class I)